MLLSCRFSVDLYIMMVVFVSKILIWLFLVAYVRLQSVRVHADRFRNNRVQFNRYCYICIEYLMNVI